MLVGYTSRPAMIVQGPPRMVGEVFDNSLTFFVLDVRFDLQFTINTKFTQTYFIN